MPSASVSALLDSTPERAIETPPTAVPLTETLPRMVAVRVYDPLKSTTATWPSVVMFAVPVVWLNSAPAGKLLIVTVCEPASRPGKE